MPNRQVYKLNSEILALVMQAFCLKGYNIWRHSPNQCDEKFVKLSFNWMNGANIDSFPLFFHTTNKKKKCFWQITVH